ncbi:4Fe-4S ferredoxin, iron-sulfur binding domain protein [Pyrobaculum islandicum DSM 4184]|uniref:4Fe-4S ferredoxin, iron-sulfur binding domain protein n=1 Tax=Pyrobaculum islandicum (strain DSM 4184 / JCM 9189 / GEO3) TaxID=384616 RepID=A1RQW1_PYRIL|nr:4Fe-4S dicluster domain-containing protein [Pyrobaculum islandicum]ABL87343.1 4Fe-4S ferredoxin, iron-sulfur binding domain protein [Pyrobaculum islandicum DSM 4184]
MTRLVLLWDRSRCVACGACVAACNAANYNSSGEMNKVWGWLKSDIKMVEVKSGPKPTLYLVYCQHCDKPYCVATCPTNALYKDRDGLVKLRESSCIGCRYCLAACPYGAVWWDEKNNKPAKCMGSECLRRVSEGLRPVCVEVCPSGALVFGDIESPSSEVSQKFTKGEYIKPPEDEGTKAVIETRSTLKSLTTAGGAALAGVLAVLGFVAWRRARVEEKK